MKRPRSNKSLAENGKANRYEDAADNAPVIGRLADESSSSDDSDANSSVSDTAVRENKESRGRKGLLQRARLQLKGAESEEKEEDEHETSGDSSDDDMSEGSSDDEKASQGHEDRKDGDAPTAQDHNHSRKKQLLQGSKQRVLLLANRSITVRQRHFINDLRQLLPHSKKDVKVDVRKGIELAETTEEACRMNNCNNLLFWETKLKYGEPFFYLWASAAPNGPSVKFMVLNMHTMNELNLLGNCLKGSRPILNFDKAFDEEPMLKVIKQILIRSFNVPKGVRGSKPFIDHIFGFYWLDGKIWFRNWQVVEEPSKQPNSLRPALKLIEIGPRCVLLPFKVFRGHMGARGVIFSNDKALTPTMASTYKKLHMAEKSRRRVESNIEGRAKRAKIFGPERFSAASDEQNREVFGGGGGDF